MGNLTKVKGVGPTIEKKLNGIGINDIKDLIYYFPKDYEKYDEPKNIIDLEFSKVETIVACVVTKPTIFRKGKVKIVSTWLDDGSGRIRAYWFNIPYINKKLVIGSKLYFRGKISQIKNGIAMSQAKIYNQNEYNSLKNNLSPVYPLGKNLTNSLIKKAIKNVLNDNSLTGNLFEEFLDKNIIDERKIVDLKYALNHIHFPKDLDDVKLARNRLVYDELLLFSLSMQMNKSEKNGREDLGKISTEFIGEIIDKLPFKLTNGQNCAINNIVYDLKNNKKLNRLIEGDVGAGKTIVAFIIMMAVSKLNVQSAFMAPTEVLAKQHFENMVRVVKRFVNDKSKYLDSDISIFDSDILSVALLTGSTNTKCREIILDKLKKGKIDIIIGTHVLYSKDVIYNNLGLCVIDEQQRFGVNQRKALEDKGKTPGVIVMSATPIPRTLSMLLYADLDVSLIKDKPNNRIGIKNYVANVNERLKAYKAIKKELDKGHQVYVVCPSIYKNDEVGSFADYQNVYDYAEKLDEVFDKKVSIEVLHGKMKNSEKNDIMNRFKNNQIQILVATTIIEVGVDVPNATFIMVEDAGAYGLSELHQLRGRVGRGEHQSYALFVDTMQTDKTKERLRVLTESNDGFYIAEEDLKLRGPGDIFGVRQSGALEFKIADMYTDIEIFKNASDDSKKYISGDYKLSNLLDERIKEQLNIGYVI